MLVVLLLMLMISPVDVDDSTIGVGGATNDDRNDEVLDFTAADPIDDPLLIYD